jgi:glucose-6-phosphate isomerase
MKFFYGRMLARNLDGQHGLSPERLQALAARFPAVLDEVRRRRAEGEFGFLDLGAQDGTVDAIVRFAEGAGQAHDHLLVLGIGGSSLGARALVGALCKPGWNELSDEEREFFPRITILENVDPTSMAAALGRIDPRRVLVNVVSKSGGTAETLAQYLVVRGWLDDALGPEAAARHLVFTTDPAAGPLRAMATAEGIPALDVPPAVGGRFSVLSPVGLLPAALVGVDVRGLIRGAGKALERAQEPDLLGNPAGLHAALHWAADTALGARIHVLMPYSDRLRDFAEWYRQLWAESLGKRVDRRGQEVFLGPTPVGAVGATDQHSQIQLFMEGPHDKIVTFIRVLDPGRDIVIPARPGVPPELAYLGGHTLGGLLRAEQKATAAALARAGRMHCILELPRLDAESLGELLMFYQLSTGIAGAWYGINPFDQPGVELGKRLTFAAMGREGYQAEPATPEDPVI